MRFTVGLIVASLKQAQDMVKSPAVKGKMEEMMAEQLKVPKTSVNATLSASARRLADVARRLAAKLNCDYSISVPAGRSTGAIQSDVAGLGSKTSQLTTALNQKLIDTSFSGVNVSVASVGATEILKAKGNQGSQNTDQALVSGTSAAHSLMLLVVALMSSLMF